MRGLSGPFFKAAILTSNSRVNMVVTKDTNKDSVPSISTRVKVLLWRMLAHLKVPATLNGTEPSLFVIN